MGLILVDCIMLGVIKSLLGVGQTAEDDPPEELEVEEVELELVEPAVPAAHPEITTLVLFNVTAPFLAKSLPFTVEPPSFAVMVVKASTFPIRVEEDPIVAEDPTCQ